MRAKTQIDSVRIHQSLLGYPYFVINSEVPAYQLNDFKKELIEIKDKYLMYQEGVPFIAEGTNGDYVPSSLSFRLVKTLLDKEARFMFSQEPTIQISSVTTEERDGDAAENFQQLVRKVLQKCNFSRDLLKSAKDCFIGKRVACLVDYSEQDGIQVHFYDSLQFYFEKAYGTDRVTKFVSFEVVTKSKSSVSRRVLVTKYEEETKGKESEIYVESALYDGTGAIVENLIERKKIDLDHIPVVIIINDGLLGDVGGVSEIDDLQEYEKTYSWIANADVDTERKGMNPTKYTVDMNPSSTQNLPTGPGAYWDLRSDQTQDNVHPSVGVLNMPMNHTDSVKTTLDRIKTSMYQVVDVPNISEETLVGSVTSGKTLRALYWSLSVRCDEKMKTWKPAISSIVQAIIDYAKLERKGVEEFYKLTGLEDVSLNIKVQENYALLDDETEEKASDMEEIAQNARSRKSYIKKWRSEEFQTDDKIDEELMQIAIEQNMFDTMSMNTQVQTELGKMASEQKVDDKLESIEAQNSLEE